VATAFGIAARSSSRRSTSELGQAVAAEDESVTCCPEYGLRRRSKTETAVCDHVGSVKEGRRPLQKRFAERRWTRS